MGSFILFFILIFFYVFKLVTGRKKGSIMEPFFPFFRIVVEVEPGIRSSAFIVDPAFTIVGVDQGIMLWGCPQPAVNGNIVPTGCMGRTHFNHDRLHLLFDLGDLSGYLIPVNLKVIQAVCGGTKFSSQSCDFEVLG